MANRCWNDEDFGPAVAGCPSRGDFDFTQLFEAAVLSILPSCLFLLAGTCCLAARRHRPWSAVRGSGSGHAKQNQIVVALLVAARCACLVSIATAPSLRPRAVTIVSGVLELVAAALMSPLALVDRRRARYPSDLLSAFLAVTILLDAARCRTLWLLARSDSRVVAAGVSFTVSLPIKMLLLFLVSRSQDGDGDGDQGSSSPDTTAGITSISLFWWLNPLVRLGYRQSLRLDDLYTLKPTLASPAQAADGTAREGHEARAKHPNITVLSLVIRATSWTALYPVFPRLVLIASVVAQASLTRRVLDLLSEPDESDPNRKYGLIGATFLVYLAIALSTAWYGYLHERALTRLRGYLVRSVYWHSAHMSSASASTAKPSTLVTVDVESIYNSLRHVHELWAIPIQIAIAAWLAYRELGPASLTAVALIAATCAVVAAVSPLTMARQRVWMASLQSRIGKTTAVLESIKTLKMAGFSRRARAMLEGARADELRRGAMFRLVVTASATLSQLPAIVAPVIVFATSRRHVDATSAFATLSYLNVMTQPLMTAIQVVPMVLASRVCLQRIQEFLSTPGHVDSRTLGPIPRQAGDEKKTDGDSKGQLAVRISGASFGWASDKDSEPVLHNVDVGVPRSTFAAVVGPVGCGKSTLIQAVLGEVPARPGGSVAVHATRVAYCAQAPVLTDGTVRDNIIGPMPMDKARYREVLEATALASDMTQLAQGDATRLESRGETLSGGQRQRVALARALYHEPDLLLADDVLSSLDQATRLWVSRRVFGPGGMLRRRGATVVFTTNSDASAEMADRRIEISQGGQVTVASVSGNEKTGDGDGFEETVDASSLIDVPAESDGSEHSTTSTSTGAASPDNESRPQAATSSNKGSDIRTWLRYFSSVGPFALALYAVLVVGFGISMTYPTLWVQNWASDTSSRHSFGYYMGVYGGIAASCITSNLLMGLVALVLFVHNAGTTLHHGILQAVMGATMRYLMQTSVGTTLTHFSQDLGIIDGMLAGTLINLTATGVIAVGQAVLLAISSPWLAIGYPFTLAVLYATVRIYVPTATRLRVLDLEAKGALVAHLLGTVSTLATMRAFGRFSAEADRNQALLARSQRPSYFLGMAQQWLLLVNNLMVAGLATALVTLSTLLRTTSAGAVGVGLVSLISLGRILADMVRAYTMVEIALGAVARLASFVQETPQEREFPGPAGLSEAWPERGLLRIDNATASYGDGPDPGPLALRNITLSVSPGEKVAILGRTGSGKSSLILMLLGMLDPLPGCAQSISIDGTPTDQLRGETLREHIIAMPQHAVFLPEGASVRENLDPLGQADSHACQHALELVGLPALAADQDGALGWKALSDGQRQLFSLARCVVRRRARRARHGGGAEGGLLLLDEISAQVDEETAAKMDGIIHREFEHYTVLAVTHRMPSTQAFRRAVVMEDGRLVEDGDVDALLGDEQSRLYALNRGG
ncbi:hypothetical protein KVR01_001025 [Diaporthe batatas]|uniref:uncharacterized protein n=1 Tax=Diaporthe batatas TaxID=748121 RepID=UPI001D04222E|nr:uncharacterized protein KVR01_001025 [Diaporthe batatas]KAG8170280.1 hypothetical protein KVR01_001025 [Diaporthe batatas]